MASSARPAATGGAEKMLELRPTVFVALGGTGMEVLLRLRRRILQHEWNGQRLSRVSDFPVAQFLYFDTDLAEARESGVARNMDPLARQVAFGKGETLQHRVDAPDYLANRRNFPAVDRWLPSADLSRIDTAKGAGQVRALSRLLFFDQVDAFRNKVMQAGSAAIANVDNEERNRALGLAPSKQLRIVVVAGLGGGTGSGAFIDAGLACRALGSPRPAAVDAFLVLPGIFANFNRTRVFANGFAALSELEHVMALPRRQPPYVVEWQGRSGPVHRPLEGDPKPFDDVYLFDAANMNGDRTTDPKELFDLMADILFEDFGNSQFAARKRSVAVNQETFKANAWRPAVDGDRDQASFSFSRGYSAVGQSIVATSGGLKVEAASRRAVEEMLARFFGVAMAGEGKTASTDDRDRFLADPLRLGRLTVDAFPAHMKPQPAAVVSVRLVDALLRDASGRGMDEAMADKARQRLQAVQDQTKPADWAGQLLQEKAQLDVEVKPRAGTVSSREEEVRDAANRLRDRLLAADGEGSIRGALFRLLDDRRNGGIDFAIDLIESVGAELARPDGFRRTLKENAERFNEVSEALLGRELPQSVKNLQDAAQGGLFGTNRKLAVAYFGHAQDDMIEGTRFWMRATAAREAVRLIDQIADHLGRQVPSDDAEPTYTGLLKELVEHRRRVRELMAAAQGERGKILEQLARPQGGGFIVVGDGDGGRSDELIAHGVDAWAQEAFDSLGGCRALLPDLADEERATELMNKLRALARDKLAGVERDLPSAAEVLAQKPPGESARIIELMLSRAMPWIDAAPQEYTPDGQQFKMIVAVAGAADFRRQFADVIGQKLPPRFGIATPTFEESGVKGRITCYCELSGVPLGILAPLRGDWRSAYEQQRADPAAFPLHNHKDELRFPSPLKPTESEIAEYKRVLALFLQGVLLRALARSADDANYKIDMTVNNWLKVGREGDIRRRGFRPEHRARLEELVRRAEDAMGPYQLAAMAALCRWTADKAYAPVRVERDGAETRLQGFGHKVAAALADDYRRRLARDHPDFAGRAKEAEAALLARLERWTDVVRGSLDDVDPMEANRAAEDAPEQRAADKRWFARDALNEQVLAALAGGDQAAPPIAPPPPPPAGAWWLHGADGTTGPHDIAALRALGPGRVTPASLVCPVGGQAWVAAGTDPRLAALFPPAPPPPPIAPPPPPV